MSRNERREFSRQHTPDKAPHSIVVKVMLAAGGIALIAGLAFLMIKKVNAPIPGIPMAIQSREHVEPGQEHEAYNTQIPTSGPHYEEWEKAWGFHPEGLAPEEYIHNLEHGGIVLLYQPSIDPALLEKLKSFTQEHKKMMLTPSDRLKLPIAITAWGWYNVYDEYSEKELDDFYNTHLNHAPENIFP